MTGDLVPYTSDATWWPIITGSFELAGERFQSADFYYILALLIEEKAASGGAGPDLSAFDFYQKAAALGDQLAASEYWSWKLTNAAGDGDIAAGQEALKQLEALCGAGMPKAVRLTANARMANHFVESGAGRQSADDFRNAVPFAEAAIGLGGGGQMEFARAIAHKGLLELAETTPAAAEWQRVIGLFESAIPEVVEAYGQMADIYRFRLKDYKKALVPALQGAAKDDFLSHLTAALAYGEQFLAGGGEDRITLEKVVRHIEGAVELIGTKATHQVESQRAQVSSAVRGLEAAIEFTTNQKDRLQKVGEKLEARAGQNE